jgi:elongation factor P
MVTASQLRAGMAIRFEGQPYKVVACEYHPGQGKMGGAAHARLQNLSTGTFWEHSFRSELKLDDLPVERRSMTYLYSDDDHAWFMDPDSFDQVGIAGSIIGSRAPFLQPDQRLPVEFIEGNPVSVQFPDVVEVRIAATAPPVHAQQDNTWKPATLGNGVEVMVPQFIKEGDLIRLDLNQMRYMDRAKTTSH